MNQRLFLTTLIAITCLAWNGVSAGAADGVGVSAPVMDVTRGWKEMPFTYEVQHPYDLDLKARYRFDAASNTHDFWVFFTDKPHAPPPNQTTARTEMRLETFTVGEHMFDADVKVLPGTFACIAQVFDEAHGPVTMIIAHPDGAVTIGRDTIMTNVINHWWNLKMTDDPAPGGRIRIYADNKLVGIYGSRGPRAYYFKCGVYSRKGSARSEALFRNVKMWVKSESTGSGGKVANPPGNNAKKTVF